MRKRILMVLTSMMLALGIATVAAPKTEVKAETPNYYSMSYDQVVTYWSATPLWQTIFDAEKGKSGYYSPITDSKSEYFKARFVDTVLHPDMVKAQTPLTYNYIKDVIAFSNPCITSFIYGYQTYNLRDKLRDELNSINGCYRFTSNSPEVETLYQYLLCQGVKTCDEYREWSTYHNTNAWGGYWNCYNKYYCENPYTYNAPWFWNGCYWKAPTCYNWGYYNPCYNYAWNGYAAKAACVNYATNQTLQAVGELCAETYVNNIQQINDFQEVQQQVMDNVQAVQNQIAEISAQFNFPQ